jgi:hypothetical protein
MMKFCIQDPAEGRVYLADETNLDQFLVNSDDHSTQVDVLLVVPSSDLLQPLPSTRLTDGDVTAVQIVDPNRNKSWVLNACDLAMFSVGAPPVDDDGVIWFAMPTARELIAAVPVFRKALVQYGC